MTSDTTLYKLTIPFLLPDDVEFVVAGVRGVDGDAIESVKARVRCELLALDLLPKADHPSFSSILSPVDNLFCFGVPCQLLWPVDIRWLLFNRSDEFPAWYEVDRRTAETGALMSLLRALDGCGYGWQKKERLWGTILRVSGPARDNLLTTSAAKSVQALIADGRRRDAGEAP